MKSGKFYTSVSRVAIWGNHSTTQVPDFLNSKIGGLPAINQIKELDWFKNEFTPTVSPNQSMFETFFIYRPPILSQHEPLYRMV